MALTRRRRCVIAAAAISLVGIATAWHLYTSSNIHRAVKYGSTLAVRRAINAGADVNAPRGDDYPPLAVAAARGHVGICRLLLDSGARVHAGLGLGMDMTAIQFAAGCEVYSGDFCGSIYAEKAPPNAIEVCRLLIEHGATRTSVRQAATWAALAGEPELLAFLLDSGPLPAREPGVCSLLEAAIDSGSPETVEVLLDRMDSPAEAAADRQQVIWGLLLRNSRKLRQYVLKHSLDIDARGPDGDTLLHEVADGLGDGHDALLKWLIDQGADVNARNDRGQTPLHSGHDLGAGQVRRLIEAGADVDARDDDGVRPILECIHQEQAVRILRDAGVEYTLAVAVDAKDVEGVAELLAAGEDVDAVEAGGRSALHYAAGHRLGGGMMPRPQDDRSARLIQLLLDAGADPNLADDNGETPLDVALAEGWLGPLGGVGGGAPGGMMAGTMGAPPPVDPLTWGMPALLAEAGGEYSLATAVRLGDDARVRAILAAGVDPNLADLSKGTALSFAAATGGIDITRLLLEHGADANLADPSYGPPLVHAARGGHLRMVRMLLKHGAGPDLASRVRGTPLYAAASEGYVEIARVLLERGADPDMGEASAPWNTLKTPLHGAVDSIYNQSQRWTDSGEIPEEVAADNANHMVALLLKHGADPNAGPLHR